MIGGREISKSEGNLILQSRQAGFYAVWSNPPFLHKDRYVVQIGQRFWLLDVPFFDVKYIGVISLQNKKLKQAHEVFCDIPEISELIQQEMRKCVSNNT